MAVFPSVSGEKENEEGESEEGEENAEEISETVLAPGSNAGDFPESVSAGCLIPAVSPFPETSGGNGGVKSFQASASLRDGITEKRKEW